MATRRRGFRPGQPGSWAWRESMQSIKRELNSNNGELIGKLLEQEDEKVGEARLSTNLAESLRVAELLSYINDALLDRQGA